MPYIKKNRSQKIKLFLFIIIFFVLGIVVMITAGHRRVLNNVNKPVSDVKKKANVSLDKVHQTSTRNGKKEWDLDARSVQYDIEKSLAIFQELFVVFYLKDKSEISLIAKQGILDTSSNDIKINNNVVIKNKGYSFYTDELIYLHKKHILFSNGPVQIKGNFLILTGKALFFNLKTNKIKLEGNVEGTVSVKKNL